MVTKLLPSSPRRRRRLVWLAATTVAVAALGAFLLLVPNRIPLSPAPANRAPATKVASGTIHVASPERRAIDKTLDRFLRGAFDQSSPATAWHLAGPELKSGSTLREWRAGISPIPYYPTRNRAFHSWVAVDVGPRHVTFTNLIVRPRHSSATAAWTFSGEVVKRNSRWLVNRLYTVATTPPPARNGTPEVIGPENFAGAQPQTESTHSSTALLGKNWFFAVAALIGLAFLVPLALVPASLLKSRRQRRRYARPGDRTLPPLPKSSAGAG